MNGLVIVDKPAGRTSHDVVNVWRRLSGSRRVGHLGTLDPMATGLLALVVGSATRLAQFYSHQFKTYEAEIRFGVVSDTYDVEGDVTPTGADLPDPCAVRAALDRFRGSISQVPPPIQSSGAPQARWCVVLPRLRAAGSFDQPPSGFRELPRKLSHRKEST